MYFMLIFCAENGFDDIAINVNCLEKLLDLASDILDCPNREISLFWFVGGMSIEENEYLETLPLIVCKLCQKERLLIYFDIKRAIEVICH